MVVVTCEKTGIQFEAKSARTKNHPSIMNILSEANRYGWYSQALEAIQDGRDAGLSTLEEWKEFLTNAQEAALSQQKAAYSVFLAEKRAKQEARRQRSIINGILSNHGYTWIDLGYADEEIDNSILIHLPDHDWRLYAPDGRRVSIRQAMKEMAEQGVKVAITWLEEHK